jgi:hypothetical protein
MVYGNQFLILESADDGKVVARYQVPVKPTMMPSLQRPAPDLPEDLREEIERDVARAVSHYEAPWRMEERLTVCSTMEEIKTAVEKAKKSWDAIQLLKAEGKMS